MSKHECSMQPCMDKPMVTVALLQGDGDPITRVFCAWHYYQFCHRFVSDTRAVANDRARKQCIRESFTEEHESW